MGEMTLFDEVRRLRQENQQLRAALSEAQKFLGELKGCHTHWYEGRGNSDRETIRDMEDFAYGASEMIRRALESRP